MSLNRLPAKLFLDDNVINVEALEAYEDKEKMAVVEVFEDKDESDNNKVEFNAVMVTPQVANTFVYDP